MVVKHSEHFEVRSFLIVVLLLGLICFLSAVAAFGQTGSTPGEEVEPVITQEDKPSVPVPVFTEYKGVAIGMSADEVREKIDKKPKIEDKDGFYYAFSDREALQVVLDENKKVKVILIIYSGENSGAPTFEEVFGSDVPREPATDGRVYKLIRYPEAGYWVAYSSFTNDNPTVTITIQKLRDTK